MIERERDGNKAKDQDDKSRKKHREHIWKCTYLKKLPFAKYADAGKCRDNVNGRECKSKTKKR